MDRKACDAAVNNLKQCDRMESKHDGEAIPVRLITTATLIHGTSDFARGEHMITLSGSEEEHPL